ncbi:MAG TPA: BadF/BadG/BcrA/BcrD ATPase family protein [Trebonia sp.]|nr:BadF/BadG/BcrA/BcrD ATPase family protein [Trebonia sp.]
MGLTTAASVLAIDGGNSKTDVALVARDGTVLASLRGPGASHEHHGFDGAMRILDVLVRDVARKAGVAAESGAVAEHMSACLAGADLPEEEAVLTAALLEQGWSRTAVAVNDTFAVLRAGLPPRSGERAWGVGVVCGAGINCVAVGPDGQIARYLALGTLTGDWGGGWGLSQQVMWHAMRAADGRGPATDLGPAAAAHFGLADVADVAIAVHKGTLRRVDLLPLTRVLFTVAATGDQVARDLIGRQGGEICAMAVAAMRRAGIAAAGTTVVLGGGLLEARNPLLMGAVERGLAEAVPGIRCEVVDVPPIAGAALLGLDYTGADGSAEDRLLKAYRSP